MVKALGDTGLSLKAGEIGEFYLRSPYSSFGYFKRQEVRIYVSDNKIIKTV